MFYEFALLCYEKNITDGILQSLMSARKYLMMIVGAVHKVRHAIFSQF